MSYTVTEYRVPSADGVHTLVGKVYRPEGEPVGLFQVVHGMSEHIERYHPLLEHMVAQGYVCFGFDLLGHGYTATDESEYGYYAAKDGWKLLIEDVGLFSDSVRGEYHHLLPYTLLGFSMGSFIARLAVESQRVRPNKLILIGTGAPNPAVVPGLALLKTAHRLRGAKYRSAFLQSLVFHNYNARFGDYNPYNWLTKDVDVLRAYAEDPRCGFIHTVAGLEDLLQLHRHANRGRWFTDMPTALPILLLSGTDDPVGNYGKGPHRIRDRLRHAGADARLKLYDNCRHDLLNETCRGHVMQDIAEFCNE